MLSVAEIVRGTQGALKLLQRDPTAPLHFDNTLEACLRSFRVMAFVAPPYAIYLLFFYSEVTVEADEIEIVFVEILRYVVDWLFFPVIFYEIARRRGWLDLYPRYISALNWINLPGVIVLVAAVVVSAIMPMPIPGLVEMGLRALFFYWFLMATRVVLGVGWGMSVLLLVVNWVPSLLLSLLVTRLLGLAPIPGG
ncbi:MAG: hypothetical protein KIT25_01935 [Enhydrobacter sp.]|nr:MAG: hypothetical protein KIT25_01935 [Enhydrobacter sp.]